MFVRRRHALGHLKAEGVRRVHFHDAGKHIDQIRPCVGICAILARHARKLAALEPGKLLLILWLQHATAIGQPQEIEPNLRRVLEP